MHTRGFVLAGAGLAALAMLLGSATVPAMPAVKISLSAEDPDVHTQEHSGMEPVVFHVFVDGLSLRAAEFGLVVSGGEFLEFNIDTQKVWVPLPVPDPYPGTIAQAGIDCYEPPVYFGKLIVRPTQSGERIVVDAIPSERDQQAVFQLCDFDATNGFMAFPAAVNSRPPPPHEVEAPKPFVGSKPLPPEAGPQLPPRRVLKPSSQEPAPVTEEDPD
jgi:hypothetical protein